MSLDVNELIAALPEDMEYEPSSRDAVRELLAGLSAKPVPLGAFNRLWILGSLQAKIAAGYLAYWIRSSYATDDEKVRQLNETHLKAALRLLGGMSYLRGAIVKVGQTLAAYPNLMPEQFAEALGKLSFEAPPMHYALLREHVRNELGGDPEELFEEFETRAFAAASLGQVHRARLKTGKRVAVKIQYPNIARTIQTDFRNMKALLTPMRLTKDWNSIHGHWDEVRMMLEAETDYKREASFLIRAGAAFNESDDIVVPAVHPRFSTGRILTMDYLDGVHIADYLATNPSQEERNRFGGLIMRSSFRVAHAAKLWYADSNPGNYLFLRDGRLGLLDFGCCREFTDEEWDYYRDVALSHREGGEAYRRAMMRAADLDPNGPVDEAHVQFLEELCHWFSEYMEVEGEYDFSDEALLRRGIDFMADVARKRYFRSIPVNIWINRHLLGLRVLAFRLGARINVKEISQQEAADIFA